jgi:hypothetical protein
LDKLYDAAHSGTMPWDQHYAGPLDLGTGLGGDDLAPATDNLQRLRPDLLDHRASLEFRILGPLEVRLDGATVGVGDRGSGRCPHCSRAPQ